MHLMTYIKDDSNIAAHIKHRFGVAWSPDDIADLRKRLPKRVIRGNGKVSGWDAMESAAAPIKRMRDDPLLKAINKHHPRIVDRLKANHVAKYGRAAR